jgi:hypothetical protein
MYMYCTVCCTFLYVLVQHARELQTTDSDMYLDTSSPGPSNKLESTLVGIPSVQNMWRGLSRGTALGRTMSLHQMGVWWPKDGFRNPFLSMFANRSSVVSEVVCPTEQCRAAKPACLASNNQWQTGIESSTLLPSNLRYQLHQTSSHQGEQSQLTAWYQQRENTMVTTYSSSLAARPRNLLRDATPYYTH